MPELTCQQCRDLAAELALDVLTGPQRAQTLAHLDRCPSCRDTVAALTATADQLITLLPEADPPAGFEQRVVHGLGRPASRTRRWVLSAAVVLLAVAVGAGGWVAGRAGVPALAPATPPIAQRTVWYAPLTTADEHGSARQIGHAYVYPGTPSWLYLSLDTGAPTPSDPVRCEVLRRDGSAVPVGSFPLTQGHGSWGGPVPVEHGTLAGARLVTGNGRTLATAHFTPPPTPSHQPAHGPHTPHGRPGHK
jgi:hypothetical protein